MYLTDGQVESPFREIKQVATDTTISKRNSSIAHKLSFVYTGTIAVASVTFSLAEYVECLSDKIATRSPVQIHSYKLM